ncbi:MAG: hypothetical protein EAZ30_14375 [Betaproteobacteria bacterium]|nr:MAG: hypothetical protein EAZ30_14375 [Betaproteobacteria bacterium]
MDEVTRASPIESPPPTEASELPVASPDTIVFVELLDKHDGVLSRHRFTRFPITLGSAYSNDLILDGDMGAQSSWAALRIESDEHGALSVATFENDANFWAPGGLTRRWIVDPDEAIIAAGQRIRIRTNRYVPSSMAKPSSALPRAASLAWLWALPLAIATFVATIWLGDIDGTKFVTYVSSGLGVLMLLALWAGIWALVSRLTGRSTHFLIHLALGALTFVAVTAVDYVMDTAAFAFNWPVIQRYDYLLLGVIIGLAVWCHGRWVSRIGRGTALTSALVVGAAMVATQAAGFYALRGNVAAAQTMVELRPPAFRLAQSVSMDDFFSDIAALKGLAEQSKPEKPDGLDFSSYDSE